ncbi:MAG: hypothetical protein H6Q33_489 [Deltaproteobacteria bacterium]|nr:hypothetical protein [Deltaproteobacteria bacterium]
MKTSDESRKPRSGPALDRTQAADRALLFKRVAVRVKVIYTHMHPAPVSIKRLGKESVEVLWTDGHRSVYHNRYLRDHCPCATCRERPVRSLPILSGGDVYPLQMAVVGRYAISIEWSDHHTTGIYSYETLRQICPCESCQNGVGKPNAA